MTIKELRTEKKLTQKAFGESIGISGPAVAQYEKGTKPSDKVIKAVKDVYGVDLTLEGAAQKAEPEKKAAPKKAAAKKAAETAVEEKASEKKTKKTAAAKASAEPEKKPAAKKTTAKPVVYIQSAMGGSITVEDILARMDNVDTVYVKVEENKAYWVKGNEAGSVDLW
ncbi:MAG: helix-turn-helix transcriptional regulator [Clostridia bacterium]|nr:helix-turn-helix transcriptional regulator [Clostridia bacterium]